MARLATCDSGELEQLYRCALCRLVIAAPQLACKFKEPQTITLPLFSGEEQDFLQSVDEQRMLESIGQEDSGPIFSRGHWRSSQARKTFRKALARLGMPDELVTPLFIRPQCRATQPRVTSELSRCRLGGRWNNSGQRWPGSFADNGANPVLSFREQVGSEGRQFVCRSTECRGGRDLKHFIRINTATLIKPPKK